MAAVQDISDSLDVLAQDVGSLLVRYGDRWRALTGGSPGDVVTRQADGTPPSWQPTAGGGGFLGGCLYSKTVNQNITAWASAYVSFDNEVYDTHSIQDPADDTKLIVPAGFNFIRIASNIYANAGSGQVVISRAHKGGGEFPGGPNAAVPATAAAVVQLNAVSLPISVVEDDEIQIQVYNGTGSTRVVQGATNRTWFGIELLSES